VRQTVCWVGRKRSTNSAGCRESRPKLLWVRWGFFGFDLLVCCFWVVWCLTTLLGGDGEWDGGVDEVEGAVLGAGGLGEFVDLDVGVLVADLIAGQGR
jgi:hypothetical protein